MSVSIYNLMNEKMMVQMQVLYKNNIKVNNISCIIHKIARIQISTFFCKDQNQSIPFINAYIITDDRKVYNMIVIFTHLKLGRLTISLQLVTDLCGLLQIALIGPRS